MKVELKNLPQLRLHDLLKRRKMTLPKFLAGFGITTFEALQERCNRMGVASPNVNEFNLAFPKGPVNDPTEGVIVIEIEPEVPMVNVLTGNPQEPSIDALIADGVPKPVPVEPEEVQKKQRKRKEGVATP